MRFKQYAIGLMLYACGAAHAGFETVEIKDEAPKARPQALSGVIASDLIGVTQIGQAPQKQPKPSGFGKDVQLLTALKQIVPLGWHAKLTGDASKIDIYMTVSWRGTGETWIQLLEKMTQAYKFSILIDWDKKELSVAPAGWMAVPAPEVIQGKEKVVEEKKRALPQGFTLQPGKTLKENITEWAEAGGYFVKWDAVDYPVTRPMTFNGSLLSEGGPLYQIIEAFRDSEQPIAISVLAGKIIKVTNAELRKQ